MANSNSIETEQKQVAEEEAESTETQGRVERRLLAREGDGSEHVGVYESESEMFKICSTDLGSGRYAANGTTTLTIQEATDFSLFVLEKRGLADSLRGPRGD